MISALLAAGATLALAACGAPASPVPSASSTTEASDATPGPIAELAPETCGFGEGARLIFAGRTTTAALQVQEVIGDPMSNDPADIYITFDEFDNGAVRGRQVCAIYVDHPGFVELTLAPEGWSPETGRPPATPTPTPAPARESEKPVVVASAEEAVEIARAEVPEAADWDVLAVRSTRLGEYEMFADQLDWSRDLPLDLRIWTVSLGDGGRGILVVVNAETGEVLLASHWVA